MRTEYWMTSNFPSRIEMPHEAISADFRLTLIYDLYSADGVRLRQSPPYNILIRDAVSAEDAYIQIKEIAAFKLRHDFPDAVIY